VSKILIIRLSSLGDIVLTSSLVFGIKKRFDCEIVFVIKKEYRDIARLIHGVDRVITFDKKKGIFFLIREINKEKFDLIVDLSSNIRSRIISFLSSAKKKVFYRKDVIKRHLLLLGINLFGEPLHVSKKYFNTIPHIGVKYEDPKLSLDGIDKEDIYKRFGLEEGFIVAISPSARHKNKIWDEESYARLIEKIYKEFKPQIVLLGTEEERIIANKIKKICNAPVKDLVGKTNLIELSCLIEKAGLFISGDTGTMHIAYSLGVSCVSLFGPTTRHFGFFPLKGVVVEKDFSCRPCSLHGGNKCKLGDHRCMRNISVDDVMEAIYAVLDRKPYISCKPNKILCVETAFIGDCLLTTPLIRGIKEVFPDSSLSFLGRPVGCYALEKNPHISNFISYDKNGKQKGLFGYLKIIQRIKKERFDLAILPHRSARTTVLTRLSNIPRRVGFDNARFSFLLTDKIYYDRKYHEAERKLSLIKGFGISSDERGLDIFIDDSSRKKRDILIFSWGIRKDDFVIGFLPFAHWETKRWLISGFAEVINKVSFEYNAKTIIFGEEADKQSAYKIYALTRKKPIIACGAISISELPAFFERCDLIIGNDTGPIYIAYGLNKKTIVILGPTNPSKIGFGPYKTTFTVIVEKSISCRPCSPHGPKRCPERHFKCMRLISPDDVLLAVSTFIKK